MDSRLIFLPQLVDRWRDGDQKVSGRVEMFVEVTEMEGCKCALIIQGVRLTDVDREIIGRSSKKSF